MNRRLMFSSARGDWRTPKELMRSLTAEFGAMWDAAPPGEELSLRHIEERDSLKIPWVDPSFLNPPYGRELRRWIVKAAKEQTHGITVVMLLPSRTDTAWWHDFVMGAEEIRFIRGRLRFDEHRNAAPFPSAIVIFRGAVPGEPRDDREKMYLARRKIRGNDRHIPNPRALFLRGLL